MKSRGIVLWNRWTGSHWCWTQILDFCEGSRMNLKILLGPVPALVEI